MLNLASGFSRVLSMNSLQCDPWDSLSVDLWITNVFDILGELSVFGLELCIFHDGFDYVLWESKTVRGKMRITDLLFLEGCDSLVVLD